MKPHRRHAAIFALVLACSLLAVACGSPKSSASVTSSAAADSSPTPVPTRPPGVVPTPFPAVEANVVGSTAQDPGITAIAALGDHVWLAVNDAMLESEDRGAHWRQLATRPDGIDSLSFVSATEGWAGNPDGLYHTTDGGASWIGAGAGPVTRVRFVDAQHGWIAGNGRFLRTTDGGATWADLAVPCAGPFGSAFAFYSSVGGWYICAGEPSAGAQGKQLFRTTDGGVGWALFSHAEFAEPPTTPSAYPLPGWGYLQDLFALDSTHLWMSVERGGVIGSTDGAHSWTPLTFDAKGDPLSDGAWFVSPAVGYAYIGANRNLVGLTTDGGATWSTIYAEPSLTPPPTPSAIRTEPPLASGGRTIPWAALLPDTIVSAHVADDSSVWALVSPCHETIQSPKVATITHSAIFRQCDPPELIRSQDGGATWAHYDLPGIEPDNLFRAGGQLRISDHLAVYDASDDGTTWTRLKQPLLPGNSP